MLSWPKALRHSKKRWDVCRDEEKTLVLLIPTPSFVRDDASHPRSNHTPLSVPQIKPRRPDTNHLFRPSDHGPPAAPESQCPRSQPRGTWIKSPVGKRQFDNTLFVIVGRKEPGTPRSRSAAREGRVPTANPVLDGREMKNITASFAALQTHPTEGL